MASERTNSGTNDGPPALFKAALTSGQAVRDHAARLWRTGAVCETCGWKSEDRPAADKCPECSGDAVPAASQRAKELAKRTGEARGSIFARLLAKGAQDAALPVTDEVPHPAKPAKLPKLPKVRTAAHGLGALAVVSGVGATLAGLRETLKKDALTAQDLKVRSAVVDPDPSLEQKRVGNYRKAHLSWQGLELTLEHAKGGIRRGVSRDGHAWQTVMKDAYGYIKRTKSDADGDHVDVFLCDEDLDSGVVFVVNQVNPATGKFDEHKVVLGTINEDQARRVYLRNYDSSWKGLGSIAPLTIDQFKWWLAHGDTSKPVPVVPKLLRAVKAADDFAARNEAARAKAVNHFLPHVREGYIHCGCGKHYYAMPADSRCPDCGGGLLRVRSMRPKAAMSRWRTPDAQRAIVGRVSNRPQQADPAYNRAEILAATKGHLGLPARLPGLESLRGELSYAPVPAVTTEPPELFRGVRGPDPWETTIRAPTLVDGEYVMRPTVMATPHPGVAVMYGANLPGLGHLASTHKVGPDQRYTGDYGHQYGRPRLPFADSPDTYETAITPAANPQTSMAVLGAGGMARLPETAKWQSVLAGLFPKAADFVVTPNDATVDLYDRHELPGSGGKPAEPGDRSRRMQDVLKRFGFRHRWDAAEPTKAAAPRWVHEFRAGNLSPAGTQRIAQTMAPGTFRTVGPLGAGSYNVADRVVGNVAGRAGPMVRKLPQVAAPEGLGAYYDPLVASSKRVESLLPAGQVAPYFAATDRGVFQELADRPVVQPPGLLARLKARLLGVRKDPLTAHVDRMEAALKPHGIYDVRKANVGPGGQLLDFVDEQSPGYSASIYSPQKRTRLTTTPSGQPKTPADLTAVHRHFDAPLQGVPAVPPPEPPPPPPAPTAYDRLVRLVKGGHYGSLKRFGFWHNWDPKVPTKAAASRWRTPTGLETARRELVGRGLLPPAAAGWVAPRPMTLAEVGRRIGRTPNIGAAQFVGQAGQLRLPSRGLLTDESALQAGVRSAPHDLAPRGVYSDWLEERGRSPELVAALREPPNPPPSAGFGLPIGDRLFEAAPDRPADWSAARDLARESPVNIPGSFARVVSAPNGRRLVDVATGENHPFPATPTNEAFLAQMSRQVKVGRYGSLQEDCPHCGARLEMEPADGTCNRCNKKWPPRLLRKVSALKSDVKLQPHQQALADEMAANEKKDRPTRKLLYWQLGSGKSLGAIAGAEAAKGPATYAVPAALRANMKKELDRFADPSKAEVLSHTALGQGRHPGTPPKTLVVDEAHQLANPESQRTRGVADLAGRTRNLLLLSGSPIANRPGDLAVPLSMLTGRDVTPEQFETRYVGKKTTYPSLLHHLAGLGGKQEFTVRHEHELRGLLAGHVSHFDPGKPAVPTSLEDVTVEMSPAQERMYKAFFEKLPWSARWRLKHDVALTDEELKKFLPFLTGPRQVGISTYPYRRDKDPAKAFDASPKLQKAVANLEAHLAEAPHHKALVFSNFLTGLEPYSHALTAKKIPHATFHGGLSDADRKAVVDDFGSGKLRAVLLGPSGMTGISTRGTTLVQLLDPHYNSTRPNQAIGRGVRFDSHTHLPEELRNVKVERYRSRLPLGFWDRALGHLGFDRTDRQKAVDDRLIDISRRKDEANEKVLRILREVGSRDA